MSDYYLTLNHPEFDPSYFVDRSTYRYADSAILKLPEGCNMGNATALEPTSDRILYEAFVITEGAISREMIIATGEQEARFKLARHAAYAAYNYDELEIVLRRIQALRPSPAFAGNA